MSLDLSRFLSEVQERTSRRGADAQAWLSAWRTDFDAALAGGDSDEVALLVDVLVA